jgi:hypothetical protein
MRNPKHKSGKLMLVKGLLLVVTFCVAFFLSAVISKPSLTIEEDIKTESDEVAWRETRREIEGILTALTITNGLLAVIAVALLL